MQYTVGDVLRLHALCCMIWPSLCRVLDALAGNDARWREREQQDAQEFLHSLLEMLQLDMANEQTPPPDTQLWQSSSNSSEPEQVKTVNTPYESL